MFQKLKSFWFFKFFLFCLLSFFVFGFFVFCVLFFWQLILMAVCMSYFSYCCDQTPYQKQLEEETFYLGSLFKHVVFCGREGENVRQLVALSVVEKQKEMSIVASLSLPFPHPGCQPMR